MNSHKVLVLGGGFAGLWSAVGAARMLDKLGLGSEEVAITLVNADPYHCIRVRNYEADLSAVRVPLDDVLGPVGVRRLEGRVIGIDLPNQQVQIQVAGAAGGLTSLEYDRLVLALGSQLNRPNIPGLAECGFDVDTYAGAARLNAHLQSLPTQRESPGLYTVVIVGAGLTGIETATEIPGRLRTVLATAGLKRPFQVILVDHNPWIGSDMGNSARPVIEQALRELYIETRTGVSIASIDGSGVKLESGTVIPAATVVWCAGMQANPLTRQFPVERDRFGRLPVDEFMKVKGIANVFAAGDVASAMMDDTHTSVMSCQHGRPMGRFAGHNVVCDLLKQPMRPLRIEWYVTILDLGPWGAVYTQGWERAVVSVGAAAKSTKQTINCHRIYPPLTKDRREILDAAEPIVQTPPEFRH
ncbi:MAG TPA: NAD(P)/FAD-dependent oxidoreductase [Bryobacteraceae bacterium]|jgi:NADH dehydrogenase